MTISYSCKALVWKENGKVSVIIINRLEIFDLNFRGKCVCSQNSIFAISSFPQNGFENVAKRKRSIEFCSVDFFAILAIFLWITIPNPNNFQIKCHYLRIVVHAIFVKFRRNIYSRNAWKLNDSMCDIPPAKFCFPTRPNRMFLKAHLLDSIRCSLPQL